MSRQEKYGLDKHLVRFSTEKECYDYLFSVKWGAKPKCPSCGNTHMNYFISTRKTYKCSQCYKQFSLTQGTIFEKSRIPLTKWFIAIYFFTTNKRGISSVQLSKWLGVTQRTAWFMLHRLREALKEENNIVLSGIVQADETYIVPNAHRDTRLSLKRKKHYEKQTAIHGYTRNKRQKLGLFKKRGRKKGTTKEVLEQKRLERGTPYKSNATHRIPFEIGTVVLGMMEPKGRAVMKVIGHTRKCIIPDIIRPYLIKHIDKSSTLITDEGNGYVNAKELFANHQTVNHQVAYVIDGIHTNEIENAWMHLKKFISGTYFHVSKRHIAKYLDEYVYRWNRRNETERSLFESFIPFVIDKRLSFSVLKQEVIRLAA